jgi:hypothetical protein
VIENLLLHVRVGQHALMKLICVLHVIRLIMIGLCKKELFEYLHYKISNKIMCILFYNVKNNDSSMIILKNTIMPILDGILFHNKYTCHTFNLCVNEGYETIDYLISIVRNVGLFIKTSPIELYVINRVFH